MKNVKIVKMLVNKNIDHIVTRVRMEYPKKDLVLLEDGTGGMNNYKIVTNIPPAPGNGEGRIRKTTS